MDFLNPTNILDLSTLTGLEIVLGVDNVVFIALLVQGLEEKLRTRARLIGLSLALIIRIMMLFGATWMMKLTDPIFTFILTFSGRDILLIAGGLFLVIKSIKEIIELFAIEELYNPVNVQRRYLKIICQIVFIDIILSFDSIITAVGVSNDFPVMVIAVVIAIIVMLAASESIGGFIYANPSIKVVALAFIAFLGIFLVLSGFNIEIDKGYLYFSMLFAGIVEIINIKIKKRHAITAPRS